MKKIDNEVWPLLDEFYKINSVYPTKISISQQKADEYAILQPPKLYKLLFRVENGDIPIEIAEGQQEPIILS